VAVTDPAALPLTRRTVRTELAALRAVLGPRWGGTELARLHRAAGTPVRVSPRLAGLVGAALAAAELTGGDVDPTVGAALLRLARRDGPGWLPVCGSSPRPRGPYGGDPDGAPEPDGWRRVWLRDGWLAIPATVLLDLDAIAPAYVAGCCARRIATGTSGGVLVAVGGATATAGTPPPGGWHLPLDVDGPVGVAVATSRGAGRDRGRHPIVDPRTGRPPAPVWRSVSVLAADCVTAKALSLAAVVRGSRAPEWLAGLGTRARLVAADGGVRTVGGAQWARGS
jgi:thiamine biosynthesis lipoprotein